MQTNDAETAEQNAALEGAVPNLERLENLLADENAGRRASLERVVADLGRLGDWIASQRANKIAALRNFADGSLDLQRLKNLLAEEKARPLEFNLFQELNLWWQEDIHSRVLTWLLGPNNSHSIGDYFLKHFLAQINLSDCIRETKDWSTSESQREWYCVVDGSGGWLDILVTNADAKFACAIENKIFSPEGGRQLTHYRKALEAQYPDPEWTRRYVFLSPSGMESQWKDEQEYWKPMRYTTILQLVEQTIDDKAVALSDDVRVFLRQYASTLRRRIVPETSEEQQLAREIYLKHREAIDLIIENRPNWAAEAKPIFKAAIAGHSAFKLDTEDRDWIGFRSADWDNFEVTQTGTNWTGLGSNALLLFQIRFYDGLPWLDLGLSSGDLGSIREKLFETVRQHPTTFRLVHRFSEYRVALHEQEDYILDASDYGVGWDDGATRAKIESWVKNFAENEFPAMNDVIVKCLREYEADENDS